MAPMPPRTPDGRYLVITGKAGPRLWRATNPHLRPEERERLVRDLMSARRAVRDARSDPAAIAAARAAVDRAKRALGERGPAWWDDGAPDFNRRLVKNSPYAAWWADGAANRRAPRLRIDHATAARSLAA